MTGRLVLAYAEEDLLEARALYHRLKRDAFEPWMKSEDLLGGQDEIVETATKIRDADVVLACVSSRSVEMVGALHRQLRLALAKQAERAPGPGAVIPVKLDAGEIPERFLADIGLESKDIHYAVIADRDGYANLLTRLVSVAGPATPTTTEMPSLPDQGAGVQFKINEHGRIDAARESRTRKDLDLATLQTLQAELIRACEEFIGCFDARSGSNAFGSVIEQASRYRDTVRAPLHSVQFSQVYVSGMRLQKMRDAASRSDVDRLMPSLEDDQQAALDSILSIHGPFVLSSKIGQELHAMANAYQANREDIQKLNQVAQELKEAVAETKGLVTDDVKEIIDQAVGGVGLGRYPEREAVAAETTLGNFLSLVGNASLFTVAAAAGGIIENVVVESLVGKDLVGLGANAINTAGQAAKQFLMQHQMTLKGFAAASTGSLDWLPKLIEWLRAKHSVRGNLVQQQADPTVRPALSVELLGAIEEARGRLEQGVRGVDPDQVDAARLALFVIREEVISPRFDPMLVSEKRAVLEGFQAKVVERPRLLTEAVLGEAFPNLPAGTVFRDLPELWCPQLVMVPTGSFLMGSPESEAQRLDEEGPQHEVVIMKSFALGRYALTFEEYDLFCDVTGRDKPNDRGWGRERHPAIHVSHEDALAYCAWLSEATGTCLQVPTEAMWEYTCRARTTTPFSFGATITTTQVNYDSDIHYDASSKGGNRQTVPVGTLPPNPWGMYEMHGNIWEWCADWYHRKYDGAPSNGNAWLSLPIPNTQGDSEFEPARVVRGGSWADGAGLARSASRAGSAPGNRDSSIGFRCARVQAG